MGRCVLDAALGAALQSLALVAYLAGLAAEAISGESIVGILAAVSGIIGSVFAGTIALRRERRDAVTADINELIAYRSAWLWAVRIITRLRAVIRTADGVDEPEGIDQEMQEHMDRIQGIRPDGGRK